MGYFPEPRSHEYTNFLIPPRCVHFHMYPPSHHVQYPPFPLTAPWSGRPLRSKSMCRGRTVHGPFDDHQPTLHAEHRSARHHRRSRSTHGSRRNRQSFDGHVTPSSSTSSMGSRYVPSPIARESRRRKFGGRSDYYQAGSDLYLPVGEPPASPPGHESPRWFNSGEVTRRQKLDVVAPPPPPPPGFGDPGCPYGHSSHRTYTTHGTQGPPTMGPRRRNRFLSWLGFGRKRRTSDIEL